MLGGGERGRGRHVSLEGQVRMPVSMTVTTVERVVFTCIGIWKELIT